eukprot:TRINITY_DN13440_c0_g1_i1.p1 TRINITY_DN13440_c0_g1~~TRINITY_DN13440_c0_g1_i1.p1  ORF type:complete len:199 (-),score=8.65 TRINITY_DN13440_c0_g1_i1:85-681(-)
MAFIQSTDRALRKSSIRDLIRALLKIEEEIVVDSKPQERGPGQNRDSNNFTANTHGLRSADTFEELELAGLRDESRDSHLIANNNNNVTANCGGLSGPLNKDLDASFTRTERTERGTPTSRRLLDFGSKSTIYEGIGPKRMRGLVVKIRYIMSLCSHLHQHYTISEFIQTILYLKVISTTKQSDMEQYQGSRVPCTLR